MIAEWIKTDVIMEHVIQECIWWKRRQNASSKIEPNKKKTMENSAVFFMLWSSYNWYFQRKEIEKNRYYLYPGCDKNQYLVIWFFVIKRMQNRY